MKKKLSIALIVLLILTLAGCGTVSKEDSAPAPVIDSSSVEIVSEAESDDLVEGDVDISFGVDTEEGDENISYEVSYPVTIIDQAGRTVVIEKEPERLVSGYYIPTSLLLQLGLKDRLVGIEAKADKRLLYQLAAPEFAQLPSVGTAKEFDLEGTTALSPDLVILPLRLKNAADVLEQLGITSILVNPESQKLLQEMIQNLSTATNTRQKGQELIDFIDEEKAFLTNALEGTEKVSVYLGGNSAFLSTAGEAMYQSSLIDLAGGKNVASELSDTYWAEISYEQLLTWNPEVIILASDAKYTVEDVLADANLVDCNAVKNDRVYQVPAPYEALDSPTPGSILTSLWLAEILHPDVVGEGTYQKEMNSYYEAFYGIAKVD